VPSNVYSVSDLNNSVKALLKEFAPKGIWIKGEILEYKISDDKRYASFQLCEKNEKSNEIVAKIQVMCWGSELSDIIYKLKRTDSSLYLKDGMFVQILCTFDLWPKAGRFQAIAKDIDPAVTVGQLHLVRTKIYEEIKKLGLHEKNKLLSVALCPIRIALISASGCAGYHDFLSEIKNSKYPFKVDFFDASVQGVDTEKDVVAALSQISKRDHYDVAVIVRGGGAITDLSWFDNKNICIAIAKCSVPVITGIGHEINLSAADMIANRNFKTPTAVAAFLVGSVKDYETRLNDLIEGIIDCGSTYIKEENTKIKSKCITAAAFVKNIFSYNAEKLTHFEEKVDIFDPKNTLRLGYCITRDKAGRVIKSIAQIDIGDSAIVCLSDGQAIGTITGKEMFNGKKIRV